MGNTETKNLPAYVNSLDKYQNTIDSFDGIQIRSSISNRSFDLTTDVRTRPEFTKADYDYWRPSEAVPSRFPDIIKACRSLYQKSGIVRNVIDLMVDFIHEDVKVIHSDPDVQLFFKVWMSKVGMSDVIREYAKHLLIDHNVVVKRITGTLTQPVQRKWLQSIYASDLGSLKTADIPKVLDAREIPLRYVFLNILNIEVEKSEIYQMVGERKLSIRIPSALANAIRHASSSKKDDPIRKIIEKLPKDVIDKILSGKNIIPLDNDTVYIDHMSKDSWQDWSIPFLNSILPDIFFKDKLRQAEISALDGVINVTRLWKLGDHKEKIFPTSEAAEKLISILQSHTGGGSMDIVWDSMIDMEEYYPPVDKILSGDKYTQVNKDILIGLGIPEVLLGGAGANFSNSWIQLKTIVERLKNIRKKITTFLNQEAIYVANAFRFDPPILKIPNNNLSDENVDKKLIIGLLDRGIISPQTVLDVYGEDFVVELERIDHNNKEFKKRNIELLSPLKKEDKGVNSKGRPLTSTDIGNRKTRSAKPRTSASAMLYALDAVETIDKFIVHQYLSQNSITNARQLTNDNKEDINNLRLFILSCVKFGEDLTKDRLNTLIETFESCYDSRIFTKFDENYQELVLNSGAEPNLSQRKRLEALSWMEIQDISIEE